MIRVLFCSRKGLITLKRSSNARNRPTWVEVQDLPLVLVFFWIISVFPTMFVSIGEDVSRCDVTRYLWSLHTTFGQILWLAPRVRMGAICVSCNVVSEDFFSKIVVFSSNKCLNFGWFMLLVRTEYNASGRNRQKIETMNKVLGSCPRSFLISLAVGTYG